MENNWKEKILNEFLLDVKDDMRFSKQEVEELIERFEIFGNLVFEATKEECADKAETVIDCIGNYTHIVNKESILNINKPNL